MLLILFRVTAIILVIGTIGCLGCWLSGPGGLWGRPLVRGDYPIASEGGAGDNGVSKSRTPDGLVRAKQDAGIPLWPDHMELLEQAKLDRDGVEGAIFTTEGSCQQQVVAFYRGLLVERGWHELSSGEELAAKAGLKAEGLYAFSGEGGTFFLGYDRDASRVHFVTMHLSRRSD